MRTRMFLLVVLLTGCLWTTPILAATVTGVVTDGTGAPVEGARVVLRVVATGQQIEARTDGSGRYALTPPAAGSYLLVVTREIFGDLAIHVDQREPGGVLLEIGFFDLSALRPFTGKGGAAGQRNRQYGRQDHGRFYSHYLTFPSIGEPWNSSARPSALRFPNPLA